MWARSPRLGSVKGRRTCDSRLVHGFGHAWAGLVGPMVCPGLRSCTISVATGAASSMRECDARLHEGVGARATCQPGALTAKQSIWGGPCSTLFAARCEVAVGAPG